MDGIVNCIIHILIPATDMPLLFLTIETAFSTFGPKV
jgi:hypothetical protein